ncbi:MAG: GNAT family N-acetyltransferase [Thermoplasmatota archaeon]
MMAKIANASWLADKMVYGTAPEDISQDYAPASNFDPAKDCFIADVNGLMVGFSSVFWYRNVKNERLYKHSANLLPEWRSTGLRRVMLRMNERRSMEMAKNHPRDERCLLETWANTSDENHWRTIIEHEGYELSWHLLEMERPNLEDIPELPLPPGVEVKQVRPDQYATVWHAAREAMKDDRSFTEERWSDEEMERFTKAPTWTPHLWQIAWKGDEVVGGVIVFIDEGENIQFKRKRGYTEGIFVSRPWRHQGVARALIARGLKVLRDQGMEQASLDVDADNLSGALRLYGSLGYEPVKQFGFYRKPMDE